MERVNKTVINNDLCEGCGKCTRVCISKAISISNKKAFISKNESIYCGHCEAICPNSAIKVDVDENKKIVFNSFKAKEHWLEYGDTKVEDLVQLMMSRRSCRNYKKQNVPKDILLDIIKIGKTAPSGTNSQKLDFRVFTNRSSVDQLGEEILKFYLKLNKLAKNVVIRNGLRLLGNKELYDYYMNHFETVKDAISESREKGIDNLFHGATAVIMVGSNSNASCPAEDSMVATQNMLLGAHALGFGTCLIGFAVEAIKRDKHLRNYLLLSKNQTIYSIIAIGYPNEFYARFTGRRESNPIYFD